MFLWRPHKFERCSLEAIGLLLPDETYLQINGWLMFSLSLWTLLNHIWFCSKHLTSECLVQSQCLANTPTQLMLRNFYSQSLCWDQADGPVNLNSNCMQTHSSYSSIVYLTIFVLIATFQGLCGGNSIIDLCCRFARQMLCPWRQSSECHWTSVTMPESVLFPW